MDKDVEQTRTHPKRVSCGILNILEYINILNKIDGLIGKNGQCKNTLWKLIGPLISNGLDHKLTPEEVVKMLRGHTCREGDKVCLHKLANFLVEKYNIKEVNESLETNK